MSQTQFVRCAVHWRNTFSAFVGHGRTSAERTEGRTNANGGREANQLSTRAHAGLAVAVAVACAMARSCLFALFAPSQHVGTVAAAAAATKEPFIDE